MMIYTDMHSHAVFRAFLFGLYGFLLPVIINLSVYRCFAVVFIMEQVFTLAGSSLLTKLRCWLKTVPRTKSRSGDRGVSWEKVCSVSSDLSKEREVLQPSGGAVFIRSHQHLPSLLRRNSEVVICKGVHHENALALFGCRERLWIGGKSTY